MGAKLAYGDEVRDFILEYSPCEEARAWLRAGKFKTMAEAWDACPRGDWMMWTLRKTGKAERKTLVALVCDFADRVLPFYEKKFVNDPRPREAIAAARAYANGDITLNELRKARAAAAAAAAGADADADAADADADAADAYAYAADAAAYAAADADADAADAYAYADAADAYAYADAQSTERKWQADRIRELVGNPFQVLEKEEFALAT